MRFHQDFVFLGVFGIGVPFEQSEDRECVHIKIKHAIWFQDAMNFAQDGGGIGRMIHNVTTDDQFHAFAAHGNFFAAADGVVNRHAPCEDEVSQCIGASGS